MSYLPKCQYKVIAKYMHLQYMLIFQKTNDTLKIENKTVRKENEVFTQTK